MEEQWKISNYDLQWKRLFLEVGLKLRNALSEIAIRIDHVGSTSVMGLDAKPIIDIQVSLIDIEDEMSYISKIESVGFIYRKDNIDKTERYFREISGTRRTHIHVRRSGSFSEQLTLLFRDYLREHPQDCIKYAEEKHRLMKIFNNQRQKYVAGKGPIVWNILQRAHTWSREVGWIPGETDI